jgi:NAD(P)-dependent dehydrogenase (short-subunit alcohol dehydrogenase family)
MRADSTPASRYATTGRFPTRSLSSLRLAIWRRRKTKARNSPARDFAVASPRRDYGFVGTQFYHPDSPEGKQVAAAEGALWYGKSGHGLFSAYCASKAALISLTHSAAAELAPDRIRVNSVAPGNVATDMHFRALREEADKRSVTFDEMKDTEWSKIPLGRAADPSEIAAAIAFLSSSDGAYLTGATIDVNGGCMFT